MTKDVNWGGTVSQNHTRIPRIPRTFMCNDLQDDLDALN